MNNSGLFNKILVPIDFSDASFKALNFAVELSKKTKAKLAVLIAIPRTEHHIFKQLYDRSLAQLIRHHDIPVLIPV